MVDILKNRNGWLDLQLTFGFFILLFIPFSNLFLFVWCTHTWHIWSFLIGPEFFYSISPDLLCRWEYTHACPSADHTTKPKPIEVVLVCFPINSGVVLFWWEYRSALTTYIQLQRKYAFFGLDSRSHLSLASWKKKKESSALVLLPLHGHYKQWAMDKPRATRRHWASFSMKYITIDFLIKLCKETADK